MTDSKTATERMEELLKAHGADYRMQHQQNRATFEPFTRFIVLNERGGLRGIIDVCANGYCEYTWQEDGLTPEQAIASTLGAGGCEDVCDAELTGRLRFQCPECGAVSLEIYTELLPELREKGGEAVMTVESALEAFAMAYDAWLDPEQDRENPIPEYADVTRKIVELENGLGECEMEYAKDGPMRGWWVCSECGRAMDTIEACGGREGPRFCGNCGRKVKR